MSDIEKTAKNSQVVYPSGKAMTPHLLRCQGFAVAYYSFTLERLEAAAPSPFATLGLTEVRWEDRFDESKIVRIR